MGPAAHVVLIIDDTADCKESCAAFHVAGQFRIPLGKINNGIVPVTKLCAENKHYCPVHHVRSASRAIVRWQARCDVSHKAINRAGPNRAFKTMLADCLYVENNALGRALLESWWTAEFTLLGYCPDQPVRHDRPAFCASPAHQVPYQQLSSKQALLNEVVRLRMPGWSAAKSPLPTAA